MKYIEHENLIAKVNHLAFQVPKREGELDRPLEWDDDKKIWSGFFLNYDDGCGMFLTQLHRAGFQDVIYHAPYHWTVKSPAFGFKGIGEESPAAGPHWLQLEYIEGDLYATPI